MPVYVGETPVKSARLGEVALPSAAIASLATAGQFASIPIIDSPSGDVVITITQQPSGAELEPSTGLLPYEASMFVLAESSPPVTLNYEWQYADSVNGPWTTVPELQTETEDPLYEGERTAGLTVRVGDLQDPAATRWYRCNIFVAGGNPQNEYSQPAQVTLPAVQLETDPFFSSVAALLSFDGANGSQQFYDKAINPVPIVFFNNNVQSISDENPKTGTGSLKNATSWSRWAPPTEILATDPLTVELWFRGFSGLPLDVSGQLQINTESGDHYGRIRVLSQGGQILFHGGPGFVNGVWQEGGPVVHDNEWHHLAQSRGPSDPNYERIYVDGQLIFKRPISEIGSVGGAGNPHIEFARPSSSPLFCDEFRVTLAERYTGGSFVPPGEMPAPLLALLPQETTAYAGSVTIAVIANTGGVTAQYQWQKREGGEGVWQTLAGESSATLQLSDLTSELDTGDEYRAIVSVQGRGTATTNATTLTVDESGINADNRFRVTAAAAATSITAAVDSTTGYWKMVASSGQESSVFGSQWSQYSPYYFNTGTLSGLPAGAEKTIEVFSCDASGNPSGELEYVSFAPSSGAIVSADASGCASLQGFNLSSSATPYQSWSGPSSLPSALVSVRAVGVAGSGGFYSQWNPNYPANVSGGINVAGQTLSGAALNQLYTDLNAGTNSARIFVAGNPGTVDDDPTIATAKGYTIFGS